MRVVVTGILFFAFNIFYSLVLRIIPLKELVVWLEWWDLKD